MFSILLNNRHMNMNEYLTQYGYSEVKRLAKSIDVNPGYLRQIAKGDRVSGVSLLKKLVNAGKGFTTKSLRPDIYELVESEIKQGDNKEVPDEDINNATSAGVGSNSTPADGSDTKDITQHAA